MKLASLIECTGCGACASICNKNCIQMRIGDNGFYYPQINLNDCIECGLCEKNCHVLDTPKLLSYNKKYYYGWDSSEDKRFEGSSGGIFGALAEYVMSSGGVVYGASFSKDKKTLYHTSTNEVSLSELKKSKYVESDMGLTIRDIRKGLKKGSKVLFCGTPCQVQGVRKVFGYRYENLVLCDFLCHGVPSQVRYRQYLRELEDKYGAHISNVRFRSKRFGWKTYCIIVDFENGEQYVKLANEDPYFRHFFSYKNLRSTCYSCNRVSNSAADITLGDFWGMRKNGYSDDDKGVSLIACNTDKGNLLIKEIGSIIKHSLSYAEVAYAFSNRDEKKNQVRVDKPFFEDFYVTAKDRIVCKVLKNRILRKIVYLIKR